MVLPQGGKISYPLSEPLKDALQSLREQFAGSFADTPGIFVEEKGSALALHFRLATKEAASRVIRDFAEAVNAHQRRGLPLEVLKGKGVIEVKPMAMNKGRAIAHILDRYGKMALPIYVGDDVTDEAAFHVVGRRGIAILVSEAPRKTAARFYLRGPDDVYTFLKDLIFLRAQKP
jgi:trehalose 6-phosphate phosphatase